MAKSAIVVNFNRRRNGQIRLRTVVPRARYQEARAGFFDNPAFLEAELKNKRLLEDYARYSQLVTADPEYREQTRSLITKTVAFVLTYIQADDREGLCGQIAHLLSRFLERQGIWNYVEKGGFVIEFPEYSKLPAKVFEPIFSRTQTRGHVWVVAPPFRLIDLAITRQFYEGEEEKYIPKMVIAEAGGPASPWPFRQGPPPADLSHSFPPVLIRQGDLKLTYFPCGIGGPEESFEQMEHPSFDGMRPFDLFQKYLTSTGLELRTAQ